MRTTNSGSSIVEKDLEERVAKNREGYGAPELTEETLSYESYDKSDLVSIHTYSPEILVIDKITYEDFRKSLSPEESFLLELMIQTTGNGRSGSIYRKIFMRETNGQRWHYKKVSKELRQKFYFHFGTEYEQERFVALYSKMLKNNSQVEYRIQNTMKNGLNY